MQTSALEVLSSSPSGLTHHHHLSSITALWLPPSCKNSSGPPPSQLQTMRQKCELPAFEFWETKIGPRVAQLVKNPPGNAGDSGSIPGWGKCWGEGNGNTLQYSCLENPHGQRNLAGYSPWDRKELDKTERFSLHFTWLSTLTLKCCWEMYMATYMSGSCGSILLAWPLL